MQKLIRPIHFKIGLSLRKITIRHNTWRSAFLEIVHKWEVCCGVYIKTVWNSSFMIFCTTPPVIREGSCHRRREGGGIVVRWACPEHKLAAATDTKRCSGGRNASSYVQKRWPFLSPFPKIHTIQFHIALMFLPFRNVSLPFALSSFLPSFLPSMSRFLNS